jgi:hypothetical protein
MSTWNPSDKSASVTLSGGNLIATWNGSGGGARSTTSKAGGKIYFEAQFTTINASTWVGLANATSVLTISNSVNVVFSQLDGSAVQGNGTTLGQNGGFLNAGQWGSFAIDLTAARFWYRPNGGLWNNNASNNPATGVGGYSISYLVGPFFVYCGATAGSAGNAVTLNVGGSSFAFAAPSGFNAWDFVAPAGGKGRVWVQA